MRTNRRELLKRVVRTATTAIGAAAGLLAAHRLLATRPRFRPLAYPVNHSKYPDEGVRLIRPPGAVPEPEFLAGCIRCYRCQDACEDGALQFFTEGYGELYHTPYVDPSIKACTLCMKCTEVCPTGVLKPTRVEDRRSVRMATIELHKDRCLSHKAKAIRNEQALLMQLGLPVTETEALVERRGPCGECYMFCPLRERAIKLEPGAFLAPEIFPDACAGCGLCEEICRQVVRGEPAIRVVPTRKSV